jgi:hypothetical protein
MRRRLRKILLASTLALLGATGPVGWLTSPAVGQEAQEPTIARLQAENRALRAENSRLRATLRRVLASQAPAAHQAPPAAPVFATHEFAARGSLFVSNGAGSIYQEEWSDSLIHQAFEPNIIFPDGKTLESGTRVRALKREKLDGENPYWARFVVVVDGPQAGTRGWCADAILVGATN